MLPQNIFTYSTFNSCCGCIVMCVSRVARVEISQRNLGQCQSPWAGFGLASECCWCCSLLLLVAVVLLSTAIVVTPSAHWTRLDRLSWSLFHYGRSWHHSVFWDQTLRLMCKCYYCEDSSGTCIMLVECCAVMLATNILQSSNYFSHRRRTRGWSTRRGRGGCRAWWCPRAGPSPWCPLSAARPGSAELTVRSINWSCCDRNNQDYRMGVM